MPPSWMPSTSQKDIVSPWSIYPPSMSSVDSPANCRCHRRFGDWSPICNLTNKSKRHQVDTSTQTNSWKQFFHQKDGRIKDLMILGPFGCLPRNPSLADPWPNWSLGTKANAQLKRGSSSNQRSNFDWGGDIPCEGSPNEQLWRLLCAWYSSPQVCNVHRYVRMTL